MNIYMHEVKEIKWRVQIQQESSVLPQEERLIPNETLLPVKKKIF